MRSLLTISYSLHADHTALTKWFLFSDRQQRAVLEPGLRGQDLIARAKTGTGKTLAFGIPILDKVIKENEKMTRSHSNDISFSTVSGFMNF